MTLKQLLKLKIVYENVTLVHVEPHEGKTVAKALRVFNRPTKLEDFHPSVTEYADCNVCAVFGKGKANTVIQVCSPENASVFNYKE